MSKNNTLSSSQHQSSLPNRNKHFTNYPSSSQSSSLGLHQMAPSSSPTDTFNKSYVGHPNRAISASSKLSQDNFSKNPVRQPTSRSVRIDQFDQNGTIGATQNNVDRRSSNISQNRSSSGVPLCGDQLKHQSGDVVVDRSTKPVCSAVAGSRPKSRRPKSCVR